MIPSIWQRRVNIERTTDGDTVVAYFDDGRKHFSREGIRLKDVWAPELTSPIPEVRAEAVAAKKLLEDWVASHFLCWNNSPDLSRDFPFRLSTEKDKRTFERYVGDIECGAGHWANGFMREAGYVQAG